MAAIGVRRVTSQVPRTRAVLLGGLPLCLLGLLLSMLASILFGAADIDPQAVWKALVTFDGSTDHLIIRTLRMPRALVAATVGAALGVAGAIMQG